MPSEDELRQKLERFHAIRFESKTIAGSNDQKIVRLARSHTSLKSVEEIRDNLATDHAELARQSAELEQVFATSENLDSNVVEWMIDRATKLALAIAQDLKRLGEQLDEILRAL